MGGWRNNGIGYLGREMRNYGFPYPSEDCMRVCQPPSHMDANQWEFPIPKWRNKGGPSWQKSWQKELSSRLGQKGKRKSAPGLPDWSPTSVLPWLDAA
jgi:hypothetical protein